MSSYPLDTSVRRREAARSRCRAGADRVLYRRAACLYPSDEVAAKVLLCSQSIMGTTAQRDIVETRRSSPCVRVLVMKLEPCLLAAALAARVDIRAASLVSLPDVAAHIRGDVSAVLCGWGH